MRTTVSLDEALLEQAKQEAARRGESLESLIESGLRLVLAESRPKRTSGRIELPISREGGGIHPGVDLTDRAALLDIMDGIE